VVAMNSRRSGVRFNATKKQEKWLNNFLYINRLV
jgi:hypothetical protein